MCPCTDSSLSERHGVPGSAKDSRASYRVIKATLMFGCEGFQGSSRCFWRSKPRPGEEPLPDGGKGPEC